jgi:hypothetical protein
MSCMACYEATLIALHYRTTYYSRDRLVGGNKWD